MRTAASRRAPSEEGEELAGGAVGPVQVLDDQHDRLLGAERLEQVGDPLVEASPVVRAAGGERDQAGDPGGAHRLAERRREGGEGQGVVAEVDAGADQGQDGAAALVQQLVDQAGLADPGLAADEHEPGATGACVVERGDQSGELGVAPDQAGGGAGGHEVEHATCP